MPEAAAGCWAEVSVELPVPAAGRRRVGAAASTAPASTASSMEERRAPRADQSTRAAVLACRSKRPAFAVGPPRGLRLEQQARLVGPALS
jgi:hypothetical protein